MVCFGENIAKYLSEKLGVNAEGVPGSLDKPKFQSEVLEEAMKKLKAINDECCKLPKKKVCVMIGPRQNPVASKK